MTQRLCRYAALAMVAGAASSTSSVLAQDNPQSPPELAATPQFQFTFKPGVWLTRLNGESTLGPSPAATTLILEEDLDLDDHETAFGAELAVFMDNRWRLGVNGFYFTTDNTDVFVGNAIFGDLAINNGDVYDASFDMTSLAIDFGFYPWEPYYIDDNNRLKVRLGPMVGARYISVDQSIEVAPAPAQDADGDWIAPFAGLRLEMEYKLPESFRLLDSVRVDAGGAIGPAFGGDGGFLAQLHLGFTGVVSPNFGLGMEYRLLYLDAENDDYEFSGGLQGLFFFVDIRF